MTRSRIVGAAAAIGFAPAIVWLALGGAPGDGGVFVEYAAAILVLGSPLAGATSILAHRFALVPGRDLAERLLRSTASGLGRGRSEWGRAMMGELAGIDAPAERRRFALGCALTSLRPDLRPTPWVIAFGTSVVVVAATFTASRLTLGSSGGILGLTLLWPVVIMSAVSFITSSVSRSFRTGVLAGGLATLLSLVGMFALSVLEAAHWYDVAGIYLVDGDTPKPGVSRLGVLLDPISPPFALLHIVIWAPWPVFASYLGSRRRRSPAGIATQRG